MPSFGMKTVARPELAYEFLHVHLNTTISAIQFVEAFKIDRDLNQIGQHYFRIRRLPNDIYNSLAIKL